GLLAEDGRLGRSWKDGRASGAGVLEDYADLAEGLLALYEATLDERWFITARQLADAIVDRFADPEGGFVDTATDHERLVTRAQETRMFVPTQKETCIKNCVQKEWWNVDRYATVWRSPGSAAAVAGY